MSKEEEAELKELRAEVSTAKFAAQPWVDRTRTEQRLKSLENKAASAKHMAKVAKPAQQQQTQQTRREVAPTVPYHTDNAAEKKKPDKKEGMTVNVSKNESFVIGESGGRGLKPGRYIASDGPNGALLWVGDK